MASVKEIEINTNSNLILQNNSCRNMTISHRAFKISIDFYYPMEILLFHEILKFPIGKLDIPHGISKFSMGN